jgi:hypothetical protein
MTNAITIALCGAAFAALTALPAGAETPLQPGSQQISPAEPAAQAALGGSAANAAGQSTADATDADPFAQAASLSDSDLEEHRGGESIAVSNQTLKAITSGNIINGDVAAGAINIAGGSLSNFSGIGNFAINTGAQVSLQSGMNLTINIGQ